MTESKFKKRLEKADIAITGVQLSGDAENWEDAHGMGHLGGLDGGLALILDLISSGERVFVRTKYADIYTNGKRGLPKTGAIYEVQLLEIQPIRQIIEGKTIEQKQIPEGTDTKAQAAQPEETEKPFWKK